MSEWRCRDGGNSIADLPFRRWPVWSVEDASGSNYWAVAGIAMACLAPGPAEASPSGSQGRSRLPVVRGIANSGLLAIVDLARVPTEVKFGARAMKGFFVDTVEMVIK